MLPPTDLSREVAANGPEMQSVLLLLFAEISVVYDASASQEQNGRFFSRRRVVFVCAVVPAVVVAAAAVAHARQVFLVLSPQALAVSCSRVSSSLVPVARSSSRDQPDLSGDTCANPLARDRPKTTRASHGWLAAKMMKMQVCPLPTN